MFKQIPKSRSEAQATCFSRPGSVLVLMFPPQTWRFKFLKIWYQKSRNNSGFYLTCHIPLKSLPSHLVTWRYNLPLKRRRLSSPFSEQGPGAPPPASRLLCPPIPAPSPGQRQKHAHLRPQDPLEISSAAPHPPHLEITKPLWTLLFIHSQRMEDSVFLKN